MLKKILIVIIILLVGVVAFIAYSGFFASVEIKETVVGPYTFVGKEYVGNYKDSGKYQDSIYNDLLKRGFTTTKGFGIYRDDPKKVDENKCRFMVGCVLPDKDTVKKGELARADYVIQRMNETSSMLVEFPLRNKLSVMASVLKVYPVLEEYVQEKNYQTAEALEIYTPDKIFISMEIKK